MNIKKLLSILLVVSMLLGMAACGESSSSSEDVDIFKEVIASQEEQAPQGVCLELHDGTILKDGDSALALANGQGAVVLLDGEPAAEYSIDINGLGAKNTNADLGWFKCESDKSGKLYVFVLDSFDYVLTVACGDVTAQFDINAKDNFLYNICLASPDIVPGHFGYAYGFSPAGVGNANVYYKGQAVTDYTIEFEHPEFITAEVMSNGKIKFNPIENADTLMTLNVNGESRSYVCHNFGDTNSIKAGINFFETCKDINPELLGKQVAKLDPNAAVAGTSEQQARYKALAENWDRLYIPRKTKGFTITWDEALDLVGKDLTTVQNKVASLEDMLLFLTASGYERTNGDLVAKAQKIDWHFNYSAQKVFEMNAGNCGGTAALVACLLAGDYDDIGYINMIDANGGGHVINYLEYAGVYFAFDVSQFASNVEYGMNMHFGLDFNEVAKEAVDAYNCYCMACAYRDSNGADLPIGWGSGSETLYLKDFVKDFRVIFEDSQSGNVFKEMTLSDSDNQKIVDARN